jgi:DNA-binding CsgD family transcriptional regulator/PAS domain-containing protein
MRPTDEARVLDALYRGATDGGAFAEALGLCADRFACCSGSLLSLDAGAPASNLILTTGVFDADARRRYAADFATSDPAPAAFARIPVGSATTTDRLIPAEQRRRSIFVHEFYRPLGLAETLGGNLSANSGRFELIGLQRGPDRPAFDEHEIAAVERLMPHVARALQIRRAFLGLEAKAAGLQAALDRLSVGVLLLDAGGAVLFVNAALQAIAARGDGLALTRAGRPVAAGADARRRLEALLADVAAGGSGGVMRVPRRSGPQPYAVLVAPAPSSLGQRIDARAPGALVLVHDPEAGAPPAPAVLQEALGLPPAAARLVAALADHDDLRSFTAREGITIHTTRFHLRTALARTGARSQAELVRLAVRLLRDLGRRPGR